MSGGVARALRPVDGIVILFLLVLPCVMLAGESGIAGAAGLLALNVGIAAFIALIALHPAFASNALLKIVRNFYPVVMIFVIFKEVHVVIQSAGCPDYDDLFIAADRWLFGIDPTVWMGQFANPVLTELLQIAYASYYFMMIALCVEVYRRGDTEKFSFGVFSITYGFILSYVGYMLLPAVGPRFTLHDFTSIDTELPGLLLTDTIRQWINAGESIPPGAANPIALAQRDVFPSGHTQMTLMTMYYAGVFGIRSRHAIYVSGALLIVSTVYLRYHYVVDLIGGAVFAAATIYTAPLIAAWWRDRRPRRP